MKGSDWAEETDNRRDSSKDFPYRRPESIAKVELHEAEKDLENTELHGDEPDFERESIGGDGRGGPELNLESEERACEDMVVESANQALERKFGDVIPPERKALAKTAAVRFQTHADFREGLLERDPGISTEKMERMLAYWDQNEIIVDSSADRQRRLHTIVHEKIHAAADPEFEHEVGERLYEGVTEHFAADMTKETLSINDIRARDGLNGLDVMIESPRYYEPEKALAQMIAVQAGDEALARAYFQGDSRSLREAFGNNGFFDRIAEKAREGRIDDARDMLVRRYRP